MLPPRPIISPFCSILYQYNIKSVRREYKKEYEPVQKRERNKFGDEVSGESTGRANRSAKRVQTPTKGSRGRTQVQELTRYRKPGATAAKPRDTRSARKADRKYTEGQQNKSLTHQEPMKGEVGTGQPTAEEARRRDGEPPTRRTTSGAARATPDAKSGRPGCSRETGRHVQHGKCTA